MPEESAHLPLTITPEELERAEIAVLLDFLRKNAAQHDISVLREQALAVGYRASVVDRACADFEEELRAFLETGLELAPEPPPARAKETPVSGPPPVPSPPPPRPQTLLDRLAEEEREALAKRAQSERSVSPWLAALILIVNALVFSLIFTDLSELALLFYSGELCLALLLAAERSARERRDGERLQERIFSGLPVESPVATPEPGRTPVPARPHEVRTETPETPRIPQRTP